MKTALPPDEAARLQDDQMLRLLSSAVQQSNDSIIITSSWVNEPFPRILFVNSGFCAMTGYTAEEVIGRSPWIMAGPLTDRTIVTRMRAALVRGESLRGETVNYRKDGSAFDLEWQVAAIRDEHGTITHCVAIQRDITQRKAAEQELIRAREAALESGRMKSRFLANMSHELRTPLNTINGLTTTLLEQELPAHLVSPLGLILQCGETLLQNIQTILTHSSLESGKFSLDSRPFSPAEVALNALRMTGERARRKGLVLDFYLDPAMPALVEGDAFRLQQVVVNFLANAIKFTDQGRVSLRVRLLRQRPGRVDLRFTVADSGPGIPATERAQLFRPFAQVDSSGSHRAEGTGLGLVISKTIIDLMGGSIGWNSRPGTGSFFHCTVPFPVGSAPPSLGAATAQASLVDRHVLIEDSRPLRGRMLREFAQAWRLRATIVPNAAGTMIAASQRRFDFALRPTPLTGSATPVPGLPVVWLNGTPAPAAGGPPAACLPDLFGAGELGTALAALLAPVPAAPGPAPAGPVHQKLGERIPLRIIAADDVATNRTMLDFMCRHLGYRTDLVADGMELVERLTHESYDLALVDVNMPRMDGLAAAREIHRLFPDPARRPRLVAVTANVLVGDRERCLAAGMDDYLAKPIVPKDLAACIERLFSATPRTAAATPSVGRPAVPLVDIKYLQDITDGIALAEAADFIAQLRDAVVRDYDALRSPLAANCTARETTEVEKIIHGLKGCFLSVGWARLGAHCSDTLVALRTGSFHGWTELPGEIHALQRESAGELQRLMTEPGQLLADSPKAQPLPL